MAYARYATPRQNRFGLRHFLFAAAATVLVAIGVFVTLHLTRATPSPVPSAIKKQLSFGVFWPEVSKLDGVSVQTRSVKYDANIKVLSFVATIDGVSTTVTEQSTPSTFNDIPNYFETLTDRLNNYTTFDSLTGKVYLTSPPKTTGELAVMNERGTLFFAHSEQRLPEERWKAFFNNLTILK